MNKPLRIAVRAAIEISIIFLLFLPSARAAEFRLYASDGIREVMKELLPQCERAVGQPITIQFNSSAVLKKRIDAGEPFDLAILASGLIDDLVKEGKVAGDSRVDIGRIGIGLGVRAGAVKSDISTPDALKQTLLRAKSITYNREGASKAYVDKLYERLGIVEAVQPKLMLENEAGQPQRNVAGGKAELVFALVTEIPPFPGIELLGPVPEPLQSYIGFTAGVATGSKNTAAAKALISVINAPAAGTVLRSKGMEPR